MIFVQIKIGTEQVRSNVLSTKGFNAYPSWQRRFPSGTNRFGPSAEHKAGCGMPPVCLFVGKTPSNILSVCPRGTGWPLFSSPRLKALIFQTLLKRIKGHNQNPFYVFQPASPSYQKPLQIFSLPLAHAFSPKKAARPVAAPEKQVTLL